MISDLRIKDDFFKENLDCKKTFRLSEKLNDSISEFASIHDISSSEVIRLILINYFDGDL